MDEHLTPLQREWKAMHALDRQVPVRADEQVVTVGAAEGVRLASCDHYRTNPLQFVLDTFSWGKAGTFLADRLAPLPWQYEVLAAISETLALADSGGHNTSVCRIAVSSGKGIGKSALHSWLFLWHVSAHGGHSQTTITSITGRQSSTRIWREIGKWKRVWTYSHEFMLQSAKMYHVDDKEQWFGTNQTWSLDNPEGFQGSHETYNAFLVDEASGIPDSILETIESGMTDNHVFLAYFSNPTRSKGRFRECFRQNAVRWQTWNIDARTVDIVNKDRIQEQLAECNGDIEAASFRKNVRGLFALEDYDSVIPEWIIEGACARQPSPTETPPPIVIGADIARKGQNKTVFTVRQGQRIPETRVYVKLELPDTARYLQELMDKYTRYSVPPATYVDADGMGIGVVDLCRQASYPVIAVHSASPARQSTRYGNLRAELWFICREWLRTVGCIDPLAKDLHEQLTDIYFHHDALDRILIEKKEEMSARGVMSPDKADSLVYTFMPERPQTKMVALVW